MDRRHRPDRDRHPRPQATLCLTTVLASHSLTDEIPARIDIALPRGHWQPKIGAPAVWHSFHPATSDLGRNLPPLTEELSIGIYDPPRSIIDAYRLRHREGPDLAIAALKRWLRQPATSPPPCTPSPPGSRYAADAKAWKYDQTLARFSGLAKKILCFEGIRLRILTAPQLAE